MEESTMLSKAPRLTEEEEDVMASQVLEIIGGITPEALQTLEEPEERDGWSLEEGDDSVFYSDEDQGHQDIKANASRDFGGNGCRRLVNSEASDAPAPQREEDPAAGVSTYLLTPETEKEVTPADPGTGTNLTPETSASTWRESLQLNCPPADLQTQPGQNIPPGEGNLPVEVSEAQTATLEPFVASNEDSCMRPSVEPVVPDQKSRADHLMLGDREPERDHALPNPGSSTLPKESSPDHRKPFNHLTSSAYSTLSYRKIRRGNTRQKIQHFEYAMMNL